MASNWTTMGGLGRALVLAATLAGGSAQAADAFDVDSLVWFKGGTLADWTGTNAASFAAFYDDFTDNVPPPSSPWIYGTGNPARYALVNVASGATDAVTESNGFLHMHPRQSTPGSNAAGQGFAHSLGVRLLSNDDEAFPERGFNFAASNAVAGIFALPSFSDGSAIGIRLTDAFSNANNMVDLRMGREAGAEFIHWRVQDFINGTATVIDSVPYAVPVGADRLVLALTKPNENDSEVFAYYGFMDSATGAYVAGGELTALGGSTEIFDGESFSSIELRAVTAVPEPASAFMWFAGMALLANRIRQTRRRAGDPAV
ncbi:hypothetical protein [Nitrogeniibacter aestuarii]|uniref:hypothetical protein n=1 Tax=Nitrogeniibacter aestuarii TaxID=2815343 RepID=UPI001E333E92|nr:hypothetical protein [Nitrogeniibacter aestuarii]